MSGATFRWVTCLLLLWMAASPARAQPYPQSEVITGLVWHWSTHVRAASESDNFATTWADDDHQYTTWGDGWGFEGGGSKTSLGVSRITGDFDNQTFSDVWRDGDGKSYGILGIDGALIMWFGPGSNTTSYNWTRLMESTDHGATWTESTWRFEKASRLIMPTILNHDRDYQGAGDYVYSYFIRLQGDPGSLDVHVPGEVDLARVHRDNLMDQSAYEFFAGLTPEGDPIWTPDPDARQPVFEDPAGVGWNLSVIYNAGLGRYILATEHTESFQANVGFFEAETPWGPWRTIAYYDGWGAGSGISDVDRSFFWNFSNKWTSPDGVDFVCIFSGTGDMDSYNAVRGSFVVTTDDVPPMPPTDLTVQ